MDFTSARGEVIAQGAAVGYNPTPSADISLIAH